MAFLADNLSCKVPLVVAAIMALLLVNTVLQYAATPALQHSLPTQDIGHGGSGSAGSSGSSHRWIDALDASAAALQGGFKLTPHDSVADVLPGGADAELLCVDRRPDCSAGTCGSLAAKYVDCKLTCAGCEPLRSSIQRDTGLQVRLVAGRSPCLDLHPSCAAWVAAGKCSSDAKSMLGLCQASCHFCLPPATADSKGESSNSSSSSGSSSSSRSRSRSSSSSGRGGGGGVGSKAAGPGGSGGAPAAAALAEQLLDACQDELSVCPYLAVNGLCSSASLWPETQCARSCKACAAYLAGSTHGAAAAAGGSGGGGTDAASSSDDSSDVAVGAAAGPSPPATSALKLPLPTPLMSNLSLYGSAGGPGALFTSQPLQEWPLHNCRDYADRCSDWAAAGECGKNIDYMMISCRAACGNCRTYSTGRPFSVVQLNSGQPMPAVGFGTAGLGIGTAAAVQFAAAAGYRMFDSAESKDWYDEPAVAAGLAAAGLPRDQLFLTSKLHPRDHGYESAHAAFNRSLANFGTHYLDLFLLHYPACFPGANCVPQPHHSWRESWRALEELARAGRVRSIGVSNFGLGEMRELLGVATIKPAVLETRSDPFAANHHLLNFCLASNITFVAYSSLGTQWINSPASINPVLTSDVIKEVAARHPGKSVAQVVLRWALQRGQVVIPRSSSTGHIPENLQLFDFQLSDAEMAAINSLDGSWKTHGLPLPVA